jgi:3-hydroxyacyl-[acyl-carrier-protein] dehydratase
MTETIAMDAAEVMKRLPHRYPFLLVDRVLSIEAGKTVTALKNVTMNEPFFQGHFPGRPVMPGVIIIEALAQAAGILAFVTAGVYPDENSRFYFVGIDKARFRRVVEPGDQLILKSTLERNIKGIWKLTAVATVGDEEAASCEMMLATFLSSTPATGGKP